MDIEEYDEKNAIIWGVVLLHETDKALLISAGDGEEHWFPKSQIHSRDDLEEKGDSGELIVTQWIIEQKGLGWE